MARFESGWQISLFLLSAALISVAVIQVLKVEAEKRYGEQEEASSSAASINQNQEVKREIREVVNEVGFKEKVKSNMKRLWSWFRPTSVENNDNDRHKRSVDEEIIDIDFADRIIPPFIQPSSDNHHKIDLGENLLNERMNDRNIRNFDEKISKLQRNDPLVQGVLVQFCNQDIPQTSKEDDENIDLSFSVALENGASSRIQQNTESYICRSYGELYLTICLTTVVNFSLIGLILLCQTLIRSKRRNKRNIDFFSNNFDEHYGKEIFKTSTSEYSPIIKNMAEDYRN